MSKTISNDTLKPSKKVPENLKEQGQQGNTAINTTHQGYQQDR